MALFGIKLWQAKKHDFSSYVFAEKYLLVNQIKNAKIHVQWEKFKDPVLINKIKDLEKEIQKRELLKIIIINKIDLNMLGKREPKIYGNKTLRENEKQEC